ncbi:hypothetical protein U1Q18_022975 [Sarracenia purpurea var. burkii]
MGMAAALLIILIGAPAAIAVQYTVGDSSGWTQGVDYTTWTAGKTFYPNDTLLFTYGSLHSVDQVSQSDYNGCNTGNAIKSYSTGSTTIPLTTTGSTYYICGTPGHCSNGMKLAITVSAATTTTPSPPGTPPSTTTPSPSGTPPSTTTPSPPPPPPPSNGAARNFGGKNYLLLELSLLVLALIAFMG